MIVSGGKPALIDAVGYVRVTEKIRILIEAGWNTGPRLHSGFGMAAWFPLAEMNGTAFVLSETNPVFVAAAKFSRGDPGRNVRMGEEISDLIEICGYLGPRSQSPHGNRSERGRPSPDGRIRASFAEMLAKQPPSTSRAPEFLFFRKR
jgi:hypothetical protein